LGLFGFFGAIALAAVMLCAKSSFGVPYLTPFAPIDPWGLRDFIYMAPIWAMRRAPISVTGKEIVRTKGKKAE
jgi:spore germination protein KA